MNNIDYIYNETSYIFKNIILIKNFWIYEYIILILLIILSIAIIRYIFPIISIISNYKQVQNTKKKKKKILKQILLQKTINDEIKKYQEEELARIKLED